MFTGIIQGCQPVVRMNAHPGLVRFGVEMTPQLTAGLEQGASVAIDGVCVTKVAQEGPVVFFEAMQETLVKTTLGQLVVGRRVNVERSFTSGAEIGGHIISGHVDGMAKIIQVDEPENNRVITFQAPAALAKYIFSKGFIALDGASLTVVDANQATGTFKIWFIPETLKLTTFGFKQVTDLVNLEVDYQTKVTVDTIERVTREFLNQADSKKKSLAWVTSAWMAATKSETESNFLFSRMN